MQNIIPFSKDIKFNTKIYEILSISLEHTLLVEDSMIDGEFIVSGEYKINDISLNTEPFIFNLPFNISLDDKYSEDTIKIDIDDFKYEIINEEILKVYIDVLIKGEEKNINDITPDVIIDTRKECDEDMNKVETLFKEEITEPIEVMNEVTTTPIFDNVSNTNDSYISYYVHIVRENDTIESIISKYNISKEDLKKYNDINQITLGNKLIIPSNEAI